MSSARDYGTAWVCVDCYFAHHYGATELDGSWYPGPDPAGSHEPADRAPLAQLEEFELADNTCDDLEEDDENGIREFSWSSCEGCGSTLGGARYRLALFERTRV